jgi:uncharacterized protein YndB with AHSA1/START domain
VAGEHHLKVMPTVLDAAPGLVAREIVIHAAPDIVFSYFTDPTKHVKWQGTEVEVDPRPGGQIRIHFGPGYVAAGTYLEVDPPKKLVYTWGWMEEGSTVVPPGSTTVEVTFQPVGDATVVRLCHAGLPEEALAFHGAGWDEGLSALHTVFATP